jgi:hypothetical protein
MAKSFSPSPAQFRAENGYDIDGQWYPRVTSIVGIKAKPALYRFYGEQPSYYAAQAVTERSAVEGTRIHEAAQAILLGEEPEVPNDIAPAIAAFRSFIARQPIETEAAHIERRIWHPQERYAGTIDILGRMKGRLGVIDIKTSQDIYRDYNLQTAAYMEALLPLYPELTTRWILRLDQLQFCSICKASLRTKGGREKVKRNYEAGGTKLCTMHDWGPITGIAQIREFPDWQEDYQGFLAAKRLWEWEHAPLLEGLGY